MTVSGPIRPGRVTPLPYRAAMASAPRTRARALTDGSYLCAACAATSLRWAGRCSACGEWNTLGPAPVRGGGSGEGSGGRARRRSRWPTSRRTPSTRCRRRQRARPGHGRRRGSGLGHVAIRPARHRQVHAALPGAVVFGGNRAGRHAGVGRGVVGAGRADGRRASGWCPATSWPSKDPTSQAIEAAVEHHRPALVVVDSLQSVSDPEVASPPAAWRRSAPASNG